MYLKFWVLNLQFEEINIVIKTNTMVKYISHSRAQEEQSTEKSQLKIYM